MSRSRLSIVSRSHTSQRASLMAMTLGLSALGLSALGLSGCSDDDAGAPALPGAPGPSGPAADAGPLGTVPILVEAEAGTLGVDVQRVTDAEDAAIERRGVGDG